MGSGSVPKNGPERERFSDADASWRHRSAVSTAQGRRVYGYKLDMAACTATDLAIAWNVRTVKESSTTTRSR